jgi:hypothetical protein
VKIYFGQIYVEPGISFPFTHEFQKFLSQEVTSIVFPSSKFIHDFGEDWDLIFRISAKQKLENLEVRGPTKFNKDCDVEYTLFLPFDRLMNSSHTNVDAFETIFDGVLFVLESLNISVLDLKSKREELLEIIIKDPKMFKND